jgi:hypothetical protein
MRIRWEASMKKQGMQGIVYAVIATLTLSVSCAAPSDYNVNFAFSGPATSSATVYAVWLEDESGKNIQNVFVCNRVLGIGTKLTGKALPNWLTKKYPQNKDINGITGASIQSQFSISRGVSIGSIRKFKVCFEIDRSTNGNTYFTDRPAFTYASGIIDLDDLQQSYPLTLSGWMSNDTDGSPYGQQPQSTIPGFAQYTFMTNLGYIEDGTGLLNDMITSAQAVITKN